MYNMCMQMWIIQIIYFFYSIFTGEKWFVLTLTGVRNWYAAESLGYTLRIRGLHRTGISCY